MNIEKFCAIAARNDSVKLLRIPEVARWLTGDLSFILDATRERASILKTKEQRRKLNKLQEDTWGRKITGTKNLERGQWTGPFGEHVARELLFLLGYIPKKPCKKSGLAPDWEVVDMLVEVKTGTYFTDGTACEKIPGVAFKYADAPKLYSKPLVIWCLGYAESYWRDICSNESDGRQYLLGVYKEMGITFRTATDIMREIMGKDDKDEVCRSLSALKIDDPPQLPKKKISIVKRGTPLPTPLE